MPYEGLGARHTVSGGSGRACVHGQIVVGDGMVGSAFKVAQPDRFVRPAQADDIAATETFELQLGGIHEAPATGNLAAAVDGTDIYINSANDTLGVAAQALTGLVLNAGWLPVGKVTEVDASRNPDVLRINSNVAYLVRGNWG